MTKVIRLFAFALLMSLLAPPQAAASDSRAVNFDGGWQFALNDTSGWRPVTLPHDWAIEGRFDRHNPSGPGGGALPGGTGWYRKVFEVPQTMRGKELFLDIDGAYMNSTVWINGHELGTRPYGYASFSYNLTPWLHTTGPDTLLVKVDNSDQPNSRWYSGCGIYRNVWLRPVEPCHIIKDGLYITTPDLNTVRIETTIDNLGRNQCNKTLKIRILAPDGAEVAAADTMATIAAGSRRSFTTSLHIAHPELWTTHKPNLYTAVADLGGEQYTQSFGIREIAFDAHSGFSLNGQPMKINGVCLHHDAGALGAVVNKAAIRRQLLTMKAMGANAIRTAHNTPAPELLDLCDSLGLMVMDECFDMWRRRKTENDYARHFDAWAERDFGDMLRRDRNHPSIILWGIGNEVLEQWSDASADTLSLAQANMILNFGHAVADSPADSISVNSLLTRRLAELVRSYDITRPITAGCNEPDPANHLFRSGALDVIGYNYHDDWFTAVPENFPGKPFIITESVSALMTRGYYRMPADSVVIAPQRWDKPYFEAGQSCSAYDNCHVPWGNTHEGTMRLVRDNDFISGQFVWTGYDYLGEPTPYGWPARSSYFGIVDLAGIPKDIYYLYQSEWQPDSTVLHVFPHWNWEPEQTVDLRAYYNNADEVELFLNGVSQGVRSKGPQDFHVQWSVPFRPGVVTAVSRRNGREVARREIRTAGLPYGLRLVPDRTTIGADGTDQSHVVLEVVDARGNLCPWATDNVTFRVEGAGFNAGTDNGNPTSLEPFKSDTRKAFYGKAVVLVQSNGTSGPIEVTASAPGLQTAHLTINTH